MRSRIRREALSPQSWVKLLGLDNGSERMKLYGMGRPDHHPWFWVRDGGKVKMFMVNIYGIRVQ